MTDEPMAVTVRNVSKRYRLYHERNNSLKAAAMRGRRARFTEFDALKDVSLEVPVGTTFGLIGENGSGKSTLLKCIARILRPDSGTIESNGKMSALLELGAGFHAELSGRENVYLNGAILGLTRKQLTRRFDDIVAFAGIEDFIDSPVKNYSSGMYLRLGFSVAINVEPEVLLVDEILAVGDEQFQRKCAEKFVDLRRQGKTVIIVSHSLGTIRNMCDRVALLEHGHLRAIGPAGEVIDRYLGDVHSDETVEEDRLRWGSGEVRVEAVEVLGADGSTPTRVRTGESVVLRIHYRAEGEVPEPVFTLSVYSVDGILVSSPNTDDAGQVPAVLRGSGHLDLRVPRLLLVPGTYSLGVAVTDRSRTKDYDVRSQVLHLDVEAGLPYESLGLTSLGGAWDVAGVGTGSDGGTPEDSSDTAAPTPPRS
ncbi:MAG: ABC transporter ATP-binding protein [Actinomycetota bacterium]